MQVTEAQAPDRKFKTAAEEVAFYRSWIARAAEICLQAAEGDLEPRLIHAPVEGDLGRLLHGINHLLDMTDAFVRESGASLAHAAQGKFFRRVILRGMRGTFRRASGGINRATEEMASRAGALVESEKRRKEMGEELRRVIGTLGLSATEMRGTAQTVDANTRECAALASAAAKQAVEAGPFVENLAAVCERVGGVLHLISQIARQTNLLALNATIEAGRAGQSGRGFAVVAVEVKELARKTTSATAEIGAEMQRMQEAAGLVSGALHRISEHVQGVDRISAVIAESVERQRESADEIADNVERAAKASEDVSSSLSG